MSTLLIGGMGYGYARNNSWGTAGELGGDSPSPARQRTERAVLAADLKLSASTVRRGIRDLRKAGLLETEQRYRKKGGKSSLLFRLKA